MSKYGNAYAVGAAAPDDFYIKKEKKEKKMGWFSRWFDKKCRDAWERAQNQPVSPSTYAVQVSRHGGHGGLDSNGLSLNIYGADGGTVLEFRHYDHIKDRSEYALHVIGQDENFEERVAHAITMEMLRKGITR